MVQAGACRASLQSLMIFGSEDRVSGKHTVQLLPVASVLPGCAERSVPVICHGGSQPCSSLSELLHATVRVEIVLAKREDERSPWTIPFGIGKLLYDREKP